MTWSVNLSRISGGQKVKKLSGEGLLPPSRSLPSATDMDGPASWGTERRRPSRPLISWCLLLLACCSTPIFLLSLSLVLGKTGSRLSSSASWSGGYAPGTWSRTSCVT